MTPFLKMHGLGNDFVVFDARKLPVSLSPAQARAVADRRLGVGCDQVIVIENSANGADALMRIYNADGGEVENCGNAARCVGHLLMEEAGRDSVRLDTEGGPLMCSASHDQVTVDMGAPRFGWRDIPLAHEMDTSAFTIPLDDGKGVGGIAGSAVSMGNPHFVVFVQNAETTPVSELGPSIEHHPMFPERTNVEFVEIMASDRLRMRVWERGAGITRACGTGACASAVAAQRRGLCGKKVEVMLDGGMLTIEWQGGDEPVFMTGPSALSFRGEIDLGALA
ncbi:MAG TPA: diaminopimelate epimerase [Rhizomicrobium sp.]|jgi:diaminopimelate epimerase|nr:diaminopimelate epimerase [Rhizomicrobium sp.]